MSKHKITSRETPAFFSGKEGTKQLDKLCSKKKKLDKEVEIVLPKIVKAPKVALSRDQQIVIDLIQNKQNVFFTGEAGTGKTFLLNYIINNVLPQSDVVRVTASTGLASVNINGTTLHSFIGAYLAQGPVEELIKTVRGNMIAMESWTKTKILLIDEISMTSGILFDKMDAIAKNIRKSTKPMGGIMIIVCGDPLQIPPVKEKSYFFQAKCWYDTIPIANHTRLTQVYRQSDVKFQKALGELRRVQLTPESIQLFQSCIGKKLDSSDGIKPTHIFPTKEEVGTLNDEELKAIDCPEVIYIAVDHGKSKAHLTELQKNCPAPDKLILKIGAQVMLVKNLSTLEKLVNGSRGVVIGYDKQDDDDEEEYPIVRFMNKQEVLITPYKFEVKIGGKIMASRKQIPLILAWGLTVHKCQGMQLDKCIISLERCFEDSQVYTAVSRARTLEGLSLTSFPLSKVKCNPIAKKFDMEIEEAYNRSLVRFNEKKTENNTTACGARPMTAKGPSTTPIDLTEEKVSTENKSNASKIAKDEMTSKELNVDNKSKDNDTEESDDTETSDESSSEDDDD